MTKIQVTNDLHPLAGGGWFQRRYEVHLTNEERCEQTDQVEVADITIYSDGCWAGDGFWNGEQIEDCSAVLPEED